MKTAKQSRQQTMSNLPQDMQTEYLPMADPEAREDETLNLEEAQYLQHIMSMEDCNDEESSLIAPAIHQISEESRQHESPVMLSARCDSIFNEDDEEEASRIAMYNGLRSPEEERRISPVSTNFLRSETELPSTMPPSFPPFLSDAAAVGSSSLIPSPLNNNKQDKPALLRSLAWSQDSQEERRTTKRRKEEPPMPLLESLNTPQSLHHRRTNSGSPTMVHWEEKIEVIELSDVLHKAIQQATPTHRF